MTALRLLVSDSHDPLFNLAVEECIFRQMDPAQRVLFLWRNANTVVIGRAQNPWKECNTRRMEEDGVTLARRSSGGGAVFHDLGNSCFTFMAGKPGYDKSVSTTIVIDALARLGVSAFASGRNDLLVATPDGDRKVSGSAYRETHDRGFHHGTLLLDADLGRLAHYLNPDPKKLAAKGISSVRSRVAVTPWRCRSNCWRRSSSVHGCGTSPRCRRLKSRGLWIRPTANCCAGPRRRRVQRS